MHQHPIPSHYSSSSSLWIIFPVVCFGIECPAIYASQDCVVPKPEVLYVHENLFYCLPPPLLFHPPPPPLCVPFLALSPWPFVHPTILFSVYIRLKFPTWALKPHVCRHDAEKPAWRGIKHGPKPETRLLYLPAITIRASQCVTASPEGPKCWPFRDSYQPGHSTTLYQPASSSGSGPQTRGNLHQWRSWGLR